MTLQRDNAKINEQLDLKITLTDPNTRKRFDPFELVNVTVIDPDGSTLEEISNISKIEIGVYQVITDASWNTIPRTIFDRWTIVRNENEEPIELSGKVVISSDNEVTESEELFSLRSKSYKALHSKYGFTISEETLRNQARQIFHTNMISDMRETFIAAKERLEMWNLEFIPETIELVRIHKTNKIWNIVARKAKLLDNQIKKMWIEDLQHSSTGDFFNFGLEIIDLEEI